MRDPKLAVEAVWRIESARLIAGLVRVVRDIDLAEELAQDALVAALEHWPTAGVPDKPGAWLMTSARNRAIDRLRQGKLHREKDAFLADELDAQAEHAMHRTEASLDDPFGDDLLRLVFIACHPVLSMEARVALTLRLLGGLSTDEIARAFLVPEATVAQRIVRAKRNLADAKAPFETPGKAEFAERLPSVLAVLYLIFNEGYSATSGEQWMRPQLCEEALRLCRILAGLLPREPEVHGLAALMEIQSSRLGARQGRDGEPVLLLDQDRTRWNPLLIHRGLSALERAKSLGGESGPYALQAAIAACHARAATADATDWSRIAALYGDLARVMPSPVVELNRAVAVGMAQGPAAGLDLVDALADEPILRGYHLLSSVRADFLAKLDRRAEAAEEFRRAAAITRNQRERALLLRRATDCER
jgi:RNA polymerase sigma factor (sigma-70 family)